ncbi:lysophospholipase [bacterium]|nr:lysophospholipase [bacterium]
MAPLVVLAFATNVFAGDFAGVYEIKHDGAIYGAEKFDLTHEDDGAYAVKTTGTSRLGADEGQTIQDLTELRGRAGGVFRDYQREVYVDELPRKLALDHDEIRFNVQINTGKGVIDRKLPGPKGAYIADSGVFSHVHLLIRRAIGERRLGKELPVVVPSEVARAAAVVEDRGDDTVTTGEGSFAARRYFVDLETQGLSAWIDREGRLVKVDAPMIGMTAELKGYKGLPASPKKGAKATRRVSRQDVTFKSPASIKAANGPREAALAFHGVLRRPREIKGRLPGVLILSDTGPQTADGRDAVTGLDTLLGELADIIAEAGYAVLTWDDRGAGKTGGDPAQDALSVRRRDAENALKMLAARADVDGDKLFVLGLGEGGNIAIRLAADVKLVHGAIAIAPSPVSFARLAEEQAKRRIAAEGPPSDEALAAHPVMVALERARVLTDKDFTVIGGKPVYLDLYREWIRHDPAADLRAAKSPVLHVTLGNDRQVFGDLAGPLAEAGKVVSGYTNKHFEKLDHFLAKSRGTIGSYADPDRKIDAAAAAYIIRWLGEKAS